ncbi:putative cold-shock DNA-binding protein [Promicromonospora sp. AC04]|uniref:cold-shock protein n=1 Tax=Promicromonospora sp. AC04 TaxID=2135723 RepID=UPI000D34355A|nr:cold shock domain-containing protein [Promicromonospora sp. AC04]PUB32424.1 putative cold-shock DNA-binding protein [Promicromonospora sp. AC04]
MVQGKVIRFDEVRGYGFVAPDSGGDDVFIHVNDLEFDKRNLAVGAVVDFAVEDGDRGLKASTVTLVTPAPASALAPAMASAAVGSGSAAPAPAFLPPLSDVGSRPDGDGPSERELAVEVTEVLLAAVPTLTAEQVLATRGAFVAVARSHGWV